MGAVAVDGYDVPADRLRHVVVAYEDTKGLVLPVARDLAEGLREGASAVVVATPAHAMAFEVTLGATGLDVPALRASGRYLSLDAAALLARFMVAGRPDRARFRTVVGGVLADATRGGRAVRAYGEMVALLWDAGDVQAAIELESLWNELGGAYDFTLLCGYPIAALAAVGNLAAAQQVCRAHSEVTGLSSCAAPERDERSRFFLPVPLAVKAARGYVAEILVEWELHGLLDDSALIVSELVSNALLHADSSFRVTVRREGAGVRIGVHDADPHNPTLRHARAGATDGRGLAIVGRVSRRWGVEHVPDGKIVWVELDRAYSAA